MWIIFVKIVLGFFCVATIGLLPLGAWFNMWVWNEIIIKHVITCGKPITSFWIMLGLTATGFSIGGIVVPATKIWSKSKND